MKMSVAKGSSSRAVRQPGMKSNSVPKNTNAGNNGNIAQSNGPGGGMLSGTPDGSGNTTLSGTP